MIHALLLLFLTPLAEVRQVARLELAAPRATPFVLRACVPLEKGVFPRADGRSPFLVRLPGKQTGMVRAQAEIVSRYPNGNADVVEIIVPASIDAEIRPGARLTCGLFLDDGGDDEQRAAPAVSEAVAALLDSKARGQVALRTRDVYGNQYIAELVGNPDGYGVGSLRAGKSGAWLAEDRAYATLQPAPNQEMSGPPLPHLMGVHAYWTKTSVDDVVLLSLRVHNGAIAGNREATALEAPLGIVYWTDLELIVPKGWIVVPEVPDPFLGEAVIDGEKRIVQIVKPNADGSLHMMGPQAQFERRFALVPEGSVAKAKSRLAFDGWAFPVRGENLWSWSNAKTARYFPQRTVLASIDFLKRRDKSGKAAARANDAVQLAEQRNTLATGTATGYYVLSPVMGWAHPWFTQEQGGVGGEGIAMIEGHYTAQGASQDGLASYSLAHRMNVCRQPEATYDAQGEIVGYHRWLSKDGVIPFDYRTNGGVVIPEFALPMRWGRPGSQQVRDVVARGLRPSYDKGNPFDKEGSIPHDGALLAWWPHDDQHLVRYTRNTKALVWLANDALAKDDLMLSAELFRLVFHESPHIPASWSAGVTLNIYAQLAAQSPHGGLPVGREHAWGIDAMCAAYSVASPEWRARQRPWFDAVTKLFDDAAMPSGLVQRFINERLLGDNRYCVTQCFESLFLIHAMRCMSESVYRDVDEARRAQLGELARRGTDYLFFGPPWQRIQADWQPDPAHPTRFFQGPRQGIAVSLNDDRATPVFSVAEKWGANYLPPDGLGGGVEIWTIWPTLQYVAEWTDPSAGKGLENKYLKRTLDCWTTHANYRELVESFHEQAADASSDNAQNWIGLAGVLQNLGVR
ncbi:MAG: hypothetical protein JNL28_15255 [Planctomycetes bacterium]|nr:hypothetical protein [Planctomycetota bacterium]